MKATSILIAIELLTTVNIYAQTQIDIPQLDPEYKIYINRYTSEEVRAFELNGLSLNMTLADIRRQYHNLNRGVKDVWDVPNVFEKLSTDDVEGWDSLEILVSPNELDNKVVSITFKQNISVDEFYLGTGKFFERMRNKYGNETYFREERDNAKTLVWGKYKLNTGKRAFPSIKSNETTMQLHIAKIDADNGSAELSIELCDGELSAKCLDIAWQKKIKSESKLDDLEL